MEQDRKFIAILNQDNIVFNVNVFDQYSINLESNEIIANNLNDLLDLFSEEYKIQEYSIDDTTITNNPASIGYTYSSQLNAFIPPCPDITYILNTEDFNWYPNPEIGYDLNNDGVMSKWISEIGGWRIVDHSE